MLSLLVIGACYVAVFGLSWWSGFFGGRMRWPFDRWFGS